MIVDKKFHPVETHGRASLRGGIFFKKTTKNIRILAPNITASKGSGYTCGINLPNLIDFADFHTSIADMPQRTGSPRGCPTSNNIRIALLAAQQATMYG